MSDQSTQELKENSIPISRSKEDGWTKIKPLLSPFRPSGCDAPRLAENELALEGERVKHATTLISYLVERGYTIHPNSTPGHEDIFGLDFPFEAKRIAFPKHIMTPNPDEDISNQPFLLIIRRDIPILYVLSGFAHEATHLDRYSADPAVGEVMRRMVEERYLESKGVAIQVGADGKITPDTMEEEAATDTQAYFLLKNLGIPVEPENYCTYVGRGVIYERIVYERIRAKLSG